jgi:hypothetical protein
MARLPTSGAIAATLGILTAKYPAFRLHHAPIGRHRNRWIAERINGHDPGLHTVITAGLTELLAALAHDRKRHGLRQGADRATSPNAPNEQ